MTNFKKNKINLKSLVFLFLYAFLSKECFSKDNITKNNFIKSLLKDKINSNYNLAPKNLFSNLITQLFFNLEFEKLKNNDNKNFNLIDDIIDILVTLFKEFDADNHYKSYFKEFKSLHVKEYSTSDIDNVLSELTFSGTSGIRGKAELLEEVSNYLALAAKDLAIKQNVNTLVIGYDTRHSSPNIARSIANVFSSLGISVLFIDKPIASPMISYYISYLNRDSDDKAKVAGIMITGSHNPSGDNGFCLRIASGAVMIENSEYIFERFKHYYLNDTSFKYRGFYNSKSKTSNITIIDNPYEEILTKTINDNILLNEVFLHQKSLFEKKGILVNYSSLNVLYDSMNGVGAYILPMVLKDKGFNFFQIDKYGNVLTDVEFKPVIQVSDRKPYPNRERVNYWMYYLSKYNCDILLSNDGDGDRFALADTDFIDWNELFVLLIDYFGKIGAYQKFGFTHIVATHTTTYSIDKIAEKYGLIVERVPVGFKNISKKIEILETQIENKVFAGFEGNGGMVLRFDNFIQDKDGMVANTFFAMLKAESNAMGQKSLKEMINSTYKSHNMNSSFGYMQELVLFADSKIKDIVEEINLKTKSFLNRSIDFSKTIIIDEKKGFKKIAFTDGSWFILRTSSTEKGKARIYAEGISQLNRNALIIDLLEFYSNHFIENKYYKEQTEHLRQWLLQDYPFDVAQKGVDLFFQKKWFELKELLLNSDNVKQSENNQNYIKNDIYISSLNGMWIDELISDVGNDNRGILEAFTEIGISIPDNRLEIIEILTKDITSYDDLIIFITKLKNFLNKSNSKEGYNLYHSTIKEFLINKLSKFVINLYNSQSNFQFQKHHNIFKYA